MYGNDVTYEYVHLPAEYYNHHWVTSSECGESRGRGEQEGVRCEFLSLSHHKINHQDQPF